MTQHPFTPSFLFFFFLKQDGGSNWHDSCLRMKQEHLGVLSFDVSVQDASFIHRAFENRMRAVKIWITPYTDKSKLLQGVDTNSGPWPWLCEPSALYYWLPKSWELSEHTRNSNSKSSIRSASNSMVARSVTLLSWRSLRWLGSSTGLCGPEILQKFNCEQ